VLAARILTPSDHSLFFHGTSSSRYFLGDDDQEYRWKVVKGEGCIVSHSVPFFSYLCLTWSGSSQLTRSDTDEEVARFTHNTLTEGLFAGERKSCLRVQPCSLDMDLVVLSFMIMEKKRRDHAGDGTRLTAHDEDPQGDGGGSGAEGGTQ
jgi:hypothetical protein